MKHQDTHIPEKRFDMVAESVPGKAPLREGLNKGGRAVRGLVGRSDPAGKGRKLGAVSTSMSTSMEIVRSMRSRRLVWIGSLMGGRGLTDPFF